MKHLFRRRPRDRDVDEEIRAHLAMAVRARIERGEDPREAQYAARREFGNVGLVRDVTRAMWGPRRLERSGRDLRHAVRLVRRSPGFAAVIVVTLALGIGANTAIFTVVHAVMLAALPYPNPDRLVVVWEESERRPGKPNVVGPANFLRWQERATMFERMAAMYDFRIALSDKGAPEELVAQAVTPDFLPTLGVVPQRGRIFTKADADAAMADPSAGGRDVVLLSDSLWRRRYGADRSIVGRTIRLGAQPVTVIGVMPPGPPLYLPHGSLVGKPPDIWFTFTFTEAQRKPQGRYVTAIGRLQPGVTLDGAQAQMAAIAKGLRAEWPAFDTGWSVRVIPLHAELSGDLRPALLVLTGAVVFVLLIACANVASLLLARGSARRREFAVRTALGAGRAQLARQLLAETIVLTGFGGALGLIAAWWGVRVLVAMSPIELAACGEMAFSYPVLAFTAGLSLATALLCGFAPLVDITRNDVHTALKEGTRQTSSRQGLRARRAFVVAQVALVTVLLVSAGLLLRSLAAVSGLQPGFDADNVITARIALPGSKYSEPAARHRFFAQIANRAARLPGVRSAGVVSFLPFAGLGARTDFRVQGKPDPLPGQEPAVDVRTCDNGYFQVMRIPLVAGRLFRPEEFDRPSHVVIISQSVARQEFATENPLGRQMSIDMMDPMIPSTIVGVVGDIKESDLTLESYPAVYGPTTELPYSAMTLVVRSEGDPASLGRAIAGAVRGLDPEQPISDVRTMNGWVGRSLARAKFTGTLVTLFAAFALLLASLGIYGVVSYSVERRANEVGVRLALGAAPGDIVAMVLRGSVWMTAGGLAIGLPLALALARYLGSMLYKGSMDPPAVAGGVGVLASVALVAAWLPARHAAHINPVDTLRRE